MIPILNAAEEKLTATLMGGDNSPLADWHPIATLLHGCAQIRGSNPTTSIA